VEASKIQEENIKKFESCNASTLQHFFLQRASHEFHGLSKFA